jgi:hypothetical protein
MLFINCDNSFAELNKVEYLMPEDGNLVISSDIMQSYENKARQLFSKGFDADVVFRMVCLPSFSPEWLVGVKKVDKKSVVFLLMGKEKIKSHWINGHYVMLDTPKGKIRQWEEGRSEILGTPVIEYSAEIDPDTKKLLNDLWETMLLGTRYPKKYMVGFDGTNYHFSMFIWGRGDLSGKTWSPDKDTNPGRLAEIGELLADYAKAETEKRKDILKTIRTKAEELQKRLKEDDSAPTLPSPAGGEGKK